MTKTYSSWTLAVAAAVGLCALAGCNQRESAKETAQDVAEERQDASENVAEERREAADTATEGTEDRAAAEYDVAVAQADGQRKIAKEKCETLGERRAEGVQGPGGCRLRVRQGAGPGHAGCRQAFGLG